MLQIKWLPAEISYGVQSKEGTEAMGKFLPKKTTSTLKCFLSILAKPQIKHFLVYLVGLIWFIKFHSTREIASQVAKLLPDNLQRFLNGSPKKRKRLQDANQNLLAQKTNRTAQVLVAIDFLKTTTDRDPLSLQSERCQDNSDP